MRGFGFFALDVVELVAWVVKIGRRGRNLTTNFAETDPAHALFSLRPLTSEGGLGEVASVVRAAVERLPRWQLAGEGGRADSVTLRCVRTTRWFRFKDDVVIRIEDQGAERVVSVTSSSRVGIGDLGQNPRNIKELFAALREQPLFADEPGR